MRILKLFYNKFFKHKNKNITSTLESIDLCFNIYKQIDSQREFTPKELYSQEILVIFPNIEGYILNVGKFKTNFETDNPIKQEDIPYDVYPILLENFFVSKDKCYLSTTLYLELLKKEVLDFCRVARNHKNSIIYSHNKRITTNVVENLLALGQVIVTTQKTH